MSRDAEVEAAWVCMVMFESNGLLHGGTLWALFPRGSYREDRYSAEAALYAAEPLACVDQRTMWLISCLCMLLVIRGN